MPAKIVVVGSCNVDLTVYCDRFPRPGETVLGSKLIIGPGGKGSNQATAASRLGANVTFIAKIGRDTIAETLIAHYGRERISSQHLLRDDNENTGTASISVDESSGENMIVVAPGANAMLCVDDVRKAEYEISSCQVMLTQLETGPSAVWESLALAKKHNKITILNPAPPLDIPTHVWEMIDYFTPNESEARRYTGLKIEDDSTALSACRALRRFGVKCAVITLGARGAAFSNGENELIIPTTDLKAVDTVGAGDAFNGALAFALAQGHDVARAIKIANCAASICVTRKGASNSMPYGSEVDALYESHYV
jgi:ribokinase